MQAMSAERCPACGQTSATLLGRVPVQAVSRGYCGPGLGMDVTGLVGTRSTWSLCRCSACDLRWYADAPAGDGPFYEALQRHDWYYQTDKAEYSFAAGWVTSGSDILEVGCGRGVFARRLPPDTRYRGLEFNDRAVREARDAGLDVEIRSVQDEAAARPESYDVVCHFQVLEHVSDPAGFMAACAAALRPGGHLVVAVPAEDSFVGLAESCWLNMPPHHLSRWSDAALDAAFRRIGVEPLECWHEPVAPLHAAWQAEVAAKAGWLSLWGAAPATVARPLRDRAGRALRRVPGVTSWLQQRGLARFPQLSRGHTVCMVGRKRALT